MCGKVEYKASVARDLKKMDQTRATRVMSKLENVLGKDPLAGKPLAGMFRGLYSLRVGDCRVNYTRTGEGVIVLRIAGRGSVYR